MNDDARGGISEFFEAENKTLILLFRPFTRKERSVYIDRMTDRFEREVLATRTPLSLSLSSSKVVRGSRAFG